MSPRLPIVVAALLAWTGVSCSSRRLIENEGQPGERSSPEAVAPDVSATHDDGCGAFHGTSSASDHAETETAASAPGNGLTSESSAAEALSASLPPLSPASGSSGQPACLSTAGPTHAPEAPWSPPPEVPTPSAPPSAGVSHAVLVSVDGLAARFLQQVIDEGNAPTFLELQSLGAWTHDARTDKTFTITLPNHTSMLTGLPVSAAPGIESFRAHFYTANTDPAPSETLHTLRSPARTYTPSVFDVVHDHGLTTAMFASKTKFSLFTHTYNEAGRADTIGQDNGRKKIDTVVINVDPAAMVDELVSMLATNPANFTFVHLNQPDGTGHGIGWGSPEYLNAVAQMDVLLGRILAVVRSGNLAGNAALIVTTDHGGVGTGHFDSNDPLNFRIPFYVTAPGVRPGDAYAAFENRFHPGETNPEYHADEQPLRNGDAGNLALYLLGLPPVPESVIHSAHLLSP